MNEPISTPVPPIPEEPKKDNKALIIGIVIGVVVLCCCCPVVGYGLYWAWNNL
jgi:hypothetical protein